jgi:hypothetical protein
LLVGGTVLEEDVSSVFAEVLGAPTHGNLLLQGLRQRRY